jgi:type I restriction enzyme R subunit
MYSESSTSHKPALELLKSLGYIYISPEECLKQRKNSYRVLLNDILEEKLKEINYYKYKDKKYKFCEGNIQQAIRDLDEPLRDGLVKTNEKIYDYLMLGRTYDEKLEDGSKRSFDLKYIDWDNFENNAFHVTEEFNVEKANGEHARPDIVLFVNGIPLAVIECKKPSISVDEAISQNIRNQKKEWIPQLFKFNQIILATNKNESKYATCGTVKKFWSVWKDTKTDSTEDSAWLQHQCEKHIKDRLSTNQDKHIISLFSKSRLLEFTKDFIVYDKNVKKIARHQQYFAVKKLLETIKKINSAGNRQGGVIWHTQGSGKSITMILFAKAIFGVENINNSKVVVVTDRINLDKQIRDTFSHTRLKAVRAKSGNHLISLVKDDNCRLVTTLVHKFSKASSSKIVNQSQNVFVLIDESHRSQYSMLHNNMKEVLPNACYIGFTGTPLMKKDLRNTMKKFGSSKPIHKYTIVDGVEDKAILPLLYEGKMVEQTVNRAAIDKRLEIITRNLNKFQKDEVMQKWSRYQKLASSSQRISLIAFDINDHYIKNFKVQSNQFKAMVATNSKAEAISYYREFEELGDLRSAVIISSPDQREGHDDSKKETQEVVQKFWLEMMEKYETAEQYENLIKDDFVNGDELDILIVVDKLLTGFDAPRATVLYIDKQMKEHTLLQAIARVNRLFEGKDYGYLIDYRGLLIELDEAMNIYSGKDLDGFEDDDLKGAMYDVIKIVGELKSAHAQLWDYFKPLTLKKDTELFEVKLEDDKKRNEFYEILSVFSRNMGIAISSEAIYFQMGKDQINLFRKELKFFQELRRSVKLRYSDGIDHKEYEARMQKLIDNYVSAEDIIRITNPVDILDKEGFEKEMERLSSPRSRADAIRTRLTKSISKKMNENPSYYKKFSERINEVLQMYKEARISEAEYLDRMREILTDYRSGKSNIEYPQAISEDEHSQAFYGSVKESFASYDAISDDRIAGLAVEIKKIIESHIKVDWKDNVEIHKRITQEIDDLLYYFSEANGCELDFDLIDPMIENIKTIALRRFNG